MLTKHTESHLDHVPAVVIDHILERFQDSTGFFIKTFQLPDQLPMLENALHGPACGDEPIPESEVHYAARPGREWTSRLVKRPKRLTRTCTVIAGESASGAGDCVLYTVFGGPVSPREVNDPYRKADEETASREFWAKHALSDA
jgi:hypothetical protein